MEFLENIWTYGVPFLITLSVVVFFHELGHFAIARLNGVRVEVFSIGFGREIFGITDKRTGTRWKFSLIPLGGYVKMFGDADETSGAADDREMSDEEKKVSFHHKRVGQRAAIVAAGPIANFVLAIVLFTGMFIFIGQPTTESLVSEVVEGSAAEQAGFLPGDLIVAIDDEKVERFADIQRLVQLSNGAKMDFQVLRDGREIVLTAEPEMVEVEDRFGTERKVPRLGIRAVGGEFEPLGPIDAVGAAFTQTWHVVSSTLIAVGQMISGERSTDDLGGPLKIAQYSGEAAKLGIDSLIMLIGMLSVNLGLINLFPVPLLDGGHLLFYGIEALIGRPLNEKAQEFGFRIGMILVFGLMAFVILNDLISLNVLGFLVDLVS